MDGKSKRIPPTIMEKLRELGVEKHKGTEAEDRFYYLIYIAKKPTSM
jgi:hypothetical protein